MMDWCINTLLYGLVGVIMLMAFIAIGLTATYVLSCLLVVTAAFILGLMIRSLLWLFDYLAARSKL